MKKIYFAIKISLVFLGIMANAQMKDELKTPNVIPPSPTVANLMNFEEVPVDHYTGQPDISVPIYSKSLTSDLSIPIVLKYSTLGLRLEQPGGWLGRGWSLDAGGVISRTVRGHADEMNGTYIHDFVKGVFQNDDFWNFSNLSYYETCKFIWNANGSPSATNDYQPDLFQISMPGFSGRFVIVKQGSTFVARQMDMTQNLKITIIWGTDKVINGFVVLDANGYKYTFGLPNGPETPPIETSKTTSVTTVRPRDNGNIAPTVKELKIVNSAWMLTSIKTPNDQELAFFEYSNSEETYKTPVTMTYNDFREPLFAKVYVDASDYNCSVMRPISVSSYSSTITQTKKLSKILFRDKSSIIFTHGGGNPENGGTLLSGIKIYKTVGDTDQYVRGYNLIYETNDNGKVFLQSINSSVHLQNDFKYDFEYFDQIHFGDNNDVVDNWGYTNGDYRSTTGQYLLNAYKKGALIKMTSRSKGVKNFIWEPHTYSYEGNQLISNFDDNPNNYNQAPLLSHAFVATEDNDNAPNQQTAGADITITHDQYVQLSKNIISTDTDPNIYEVQFVKASNQNVVVASKPLMELPGVLFVPVGIYKVRVRVMSMETGMDNKPIKGFINVSYNVKETVNYQNWLLGGGLRIRAIDFYDSTAQQPSPPLRRFNYNYNMTTVASGSIGHNPPTIIVSSGSTDTRTGSRYREYNSEDKRVVFTDQFFSEGLVVTLKYKTRTNTLNTQLTRGGYVGYKRVAAEEGLSLTAGIGIKGSTPNGYTEYIFTNAIDEPGNLGAFVFPYLEYTNADIMRGLLKKKSIFSKTGILLEEQTYDYDKVENFIIKTYTIKPENCTWIVFYNTYDGYLNMNVENPIPCNPPVCPNMYYYNCGSYPPFNFLSTDISAGRAFLKSVITKQYFNTTEPIIKKTDYTYLHGYNYQMLTQTETFKEGLNDITLKTEYQYPVGGYNIDFFDSAEEGTIDNMANIYNIINKPIVVYNYKNDVLLNTMVNKYKPFAANQVLLGKVQTLKGPLSEGSSEDRLIFHSYNEIGNVTDVSIFDGTHTSYIWGYEGTLPIAKIDDTEYSSLVPATRDAAIAASNTGVEANLSPALEALRNYSYKITTLSHDTVYGVTSMTDPKGLKLTYGYDYLGRLIWVKDKYDKLVTEYVYKFKGLF